MHLLIHWLWRNESIIKTIKQVQLLKKIKCHRLPSPLTLIFKLLQIDVGQVGPGSDVKRSKLDLFILTLVICHTTPIPSLCRWPASVFVYGFPKALTSPWLSPATVREHLFTVFLVYLPFSSSACSLAHFALLPQFLWPTSALYSTLLLLFISWQLQISNFSRIYPYFSLSHPGPSAITAL